MVYNVYIGNRREGLEILTQPTEKRNLTEGALAYEKKHIDMLNEALGDIELTAQEQRSLIWLCQWETSTVKNIITAFQKANKKPGVGGRPKKANSTEIAELKEQGLTQEQVAYELKVSVATVRRHWK